MGFNKITETDLVNKGVVGLPDTPGLDSMQMQRKFDELSLDVIIPKHNKLVEALNADDVAGNLKGLDPSTKEIESLQNIIDTEYEKLNCVDKVKHTHENKTILDMVTEAFLNGINRLTTLLTGINEVSTSVTNDNTKIPTSGAIVNYVKNLGGGDMMKSTYDKDGDGIVDNASSLGGKPAAQYALKDDVQSAGETITYAEYEALPEEEKNGLFFISDLDAQGNAETIPYDNKTSGLSAKNVQNAIDEINSNLSQLKFMVDYSKVIKDTFDAGETWTATEDCWIVGVLGHEYSAHGAQDSALIINNTTVATAFTNTGKVYSSVYIPMKKGVSVRLAPVGQYLIKAYGV